MGVGAALMGECVVDTRYGYFVNHDLAEYHVPVHADIPNLDVIFLPELDDKSSPMKAKGAGELGVCGVGAEVANAVYDATGTRVRDYPLTMDKLLDGTGLGAEVANYGHSIKEAGVHSIVAGLVCFDRACSRYR